MMNCFSDEEISPNKSAPYLTLYPKIIEKLGIYKA
jgi:hypothetical protein